jgi:ABC-type multidrug transport system fused ATPase/permease subunit
VRLPILIVVCLLDLSFAVALTLSTLDYDVLRLLRAAWFVDAAPFATTTGDVSFLALLRCVLVPLLTVWRARRAVRDRALAKAQAERENAPTSAALGANAPKAATKAKGVSINGDDGDDDNERAPLLAEHSSAAQKSTFSVLKQIDIDRFVSRHTQAVHAMNRILLGVLFVLLTTCLVFTGVKVVLFEFVPAPGSPLFTFQATAMSLAVLFMTVELWLARDILHESSKDEGRLVPSLHLHPLVLDETVAGHWCDMCDTRIEDRVAYVCRTCNFDVCFECFKKASKKQSEDELRGDKGHRGEKELSNWDYVKRSLVYVKPVWPYILVALVVIVCRSVSSVLLPSYQGAILDRVIAKDVSGFWKQITFYASFTGAVMVLSSLQSLCFNIAGRSMGAFVKNELFRSILVQDIAFFDGIGSGQLTSRLNGDVWAMMSPIQAALGSTVGSSLQLVGALVMCVNTSFRLSVLAFCSIAPIVMLYRVYATWSRKINHRIWAAWGDSTAKATQALKNIRTVRAFSMEPKEIEGFEGATGEGLKMGIKDAFAGMLTSFLSNTIDMGITILLLVYGGLEAMSGNGLTVGQLITFQLYWNQINSSYNSLTQVFSSFTQAGGAAQRVVSLLDSLPDIDVHSGETIARAEFRGALELRDVNFTYQMRPTEPVLRGVNLKIEAGKTLALVGRSGGGKSTIIHLLLRFYDPTSGQVLVDGRDLRDLCALEYRRNVGVVTQETQLFSGTIGENIAYGSQVYTQAEVEAAARAANCAEFIERMDEKYATKCGENGVRLSGGQRQRLALARVLMRKPQILLLDEATSALDTESETLVQAAIDRMLHERKCTVVLVAHRLSTVINADAIAVIDKGRVVEQGTHAELLALGGIYAKLVGKQLQKEANLIGADDDNKNKNDDDDDDDAKTKSKKSKSSETAVTIDELLAEEDEDEDNKEE